MDIHVIKRNGSHERCHPDKINRLLEWACEGLEARAMDVAMRAQLNLFDRIPTRAILTVLVDAAAGLISVERPAYQYVTARLMLAGLRKEVWGGIVPPSLDYHVRMVHDLGFYADWTVEEFTEAELEQLDAHIDHDRDFQFTAAALNQMKEKYLLQDRVDRRCFETPQFAYMLIAMGLYSKCPDRIRRICAAYDDYTLRRLSIPTPLLAGMRSRINSYASCALIEFGDSLKSIMASLTDCATAITTRYGLGIDAAAIRAIGAPIRGGEAVHSGVIPMLKIMEPVVRGLYQNGVRQGSATVNFQWWHYEMPEILMLKDPGGSHDQRVRHLDYAIAVEGAVFFERSLRRQEVTLFSPHEVPELLASMGRPEFKALYEAAEANPAIRMKRRVPARELLDTLLKQRFNTTRYYVLFADNVNAHVPWLAHVRMSNLCLTGETRLLTSHGYLTLRELWDRQGRATMESAPTTLSFVRNRHGLATSSPVTLTAVSAPVYELRLVTGQTIRGTAEHEIVMEDGSREPLGSLVKGDMVQLSPLGDAFGDYSDPVFAELAGLVIGDGSVAWTKDRPDYLNAWVRLWGSDIEETGPRLSQMLRLFYDANHVMNHDMGPEYEFTGKPMKVGTKLRASVTSSVLGQELKRQGVVPGDKHRIPSRIWEGDKATVAAFLRGLYTADGTVGAYGSACSVTIAQANRKLLEDVQLLLSMFGIRSVLHTASEAKVMVRDDGRGGKAPYQHQATWRLCFSSRDNIVLFREHIGFGQATKNAKLDAWLADHPGSRNSRIRYAAPVESVTYAGEEDTFCLNEPANHEIVVNGIVTGQCMEILQPTVASRFHGDPRAESGICLLSCINIVETAEEDIAAVCENAVRGLEEMIDVQDYFSPAAENFCKRRRSLGIGLTNVAAYLAKNGLTYDHPEAPNRIARVMEKVQFHLVRTSMELAKERGPCELYHETKWSKGVLPIDTYKKSLDAVVTEPLHEDWEWLRGEIAKYGMRHSTLSAQPPVESTSVVQNATNGGEPPTSLVGAKTSKSGDAPFLVPGAGEYHQNYKLAFDYEDNLGFIRCAAAMQKFMCMGISLNFYYNAGKKTVPMELLARELFTAWQLGLHTLYYLKPNDGDKQTVAHEDEHAHAAVQDGSGCDAGGCAL